jgi:hypothetical protein
MIAEDDIGRLQAFHINGIQGVLLADEADLGQDPNNPGEPGGLPNGIFGSFVMLFPTIIYFHKTILCIFFLGIPFLILADFCGNRK